MTDPRRAPRRGRTRAVAVAACALLVAASAACDGSGTSSTKGSAAATSSAVTDPSGVAMPVGDLTGWKQVFTEDFTKPVALGSWPGSYKKKWTSYDGGQDTAKVGVWATKKTVSVSGGAADYYLHSVDGVPQSAAILPRTDPQTYGRYSVRFKVSTGLTGWASAWLLFPDDDVWPAHGEIDWPEGDLDGTMSANQHYANADGGVDSFESGVSFTSGWHTATTEWTAGQVRFFLDGKVVGTSTTQVSSYPMHWVLQSETAYGAKPAATATGHISIDWAVAYTRS